MLQLQSRHIVSEEQRQAACWGRKGRKDGHCPLHSGRPSHWVLGHSPCEDHPQQRLHQDPRAAAPSVSTVVQVFITAKNCSLRALCVCPGGGVLQKRSGSYSLKTALREAKEPWLVLLSA